MSRSALTAAVFLFADAFTQAGTGIGHADANLPVCAQTYGKSDGISCDYASYEQCRAYVSGLAGSCIDNPYYRAGSIQAPPRRRIRR
ncbi:DUF3551 domain-containing protein [Bradyrhizobium sp.]|uniref:DUF3551 domain-containing protein n=1 Tax=Bradyrhizobium sp. TaxID=376 RepID=UPI0025C4EFEA|nr:DUF3551 domain-containing protein [Bradyrhizobium sp.]